VEAKLPRPRAFRLEPVAHHMRPDSTRRAVLRDLLEEIAVRVEEEGQPRREGIDVESGVDAVLHILDAVAQREGELLRGGGARFADVVPAHRDGVPARHTLDAEGED